MLMILLNDILHLKENSEKKNIRVDLIQHIWEYLVVPGFFFLFFFNIAVTLKNNPHH